LVIGIWSLTKDESKNSILPTFSVDPNRPYRLGDVMGPIFLEKDSVGSNGHLSKDGRRGWDGGYQCPYMEFH
jgi:hypothetical protein